MNNTMENRGKADKVESGRMAQERVIIISMGIGDKKNMKGVAM